MSTNFLNGEQENMAEQYNAYLAAQKQFDGVAELMGLDQAMRDLLRQPRQEFHFTIPVKMDDGSTRVSTVSVYSITTPGDQERVASDSIPKRQWTPSGSCHVDDLEMCGSGFPWRSQREVLSAIHGNCLLGNRNGSAGAMSDNWQRT